MWVADYSTNNPPTGIWNDWTGFQFTDTARIDGINANVDRDKFKQAIFISSDESNTVSTNIRYTVKRGDTLWEISRRYNTTVSELVRTNNIKNPNLIYAGEVILIP